MFSPAVFQNLAVAKKSEGNGVVPGMINFCNRDCPNKCIEKDLKLTLTEEADHFAAHYI